MSNDDPANVFGGVWKKLGECRVLQCADDDHPAGTTEEAGLPDIVGAREWPRRMIDGLIFWERDHCRKSYDSELGGLQLPERERSS